MKVFSLGEMIAHLATVDADMKVAEELAIVKSCRLVARKAKALIGHEQPYWPGLAESTIEDKKRHGYRVPAPLLRTGTLRDSIEFSAPHREGTETVGYVGSNDMIAVYQELGTRHIPPRPFLSMAAAGQENEIHRMVGDIMFQTAINGGPHFRELRELMRMGREIWQKFKEMLPEDEDSNRERR